MAKKNRSTLKRYFSEGAMPTSDHFGDLIDSSLNTVDEGFTRTPENGYEISLIGEHERLLSFFRQCDDDDVPVWSISYDKRRDTLTFIKPDDDEHTTPPLTLAREGRVGINHKNPQWNLDVDGIIAAKGRVGTCLGGKDKIPDDGRAFIPADGEWHNITGPLQGCHAYEVMAGVGKEKTGQYSLMNAIAINTFNPRGWLFNFLNLKKRIKYNQAYYLSRSYKMKLRWKQGDEDGVYYLQMRTNSHFGDGDIKARYYLTQLWFDEDMSGSWDPDEVPQTEPGQTE
ncbi:hypothetical protein ACFL2V_06905 [Pseudomonadota bacterium]